MFPELFKVGSFPIRTYGVLLVLGVLVAIYLSRKRAPRFGVEPDKIWDASIWMVLPGILGARLVYIAQHWDYYQRHQNELWSLRFEGLTSFGGLIFGFFGLLAWRLRSRTPLWPFLDTIGVPVLVAQAIGRIGCLLNGCCYGRPTTEWYGVHFHGIEGRHVPAQWVDFALMLAGALVVTVWERRATWKPGVSFGLFMVMYGISRFVYEIFRAGTREEFERGIASSALVPGLPVTSAQVTCLAVVVIGIVIVAVRSRSASPSPVPEGTPSA